MPWLIALSLAAIPLCIITGAVLAVWVIKQFMIDEEGLDSASEDVV